jgi:hypothetical protein
MNKCPQCKAEYADGEDCNNRFNMCLTIEYENPATFGAVHHLTVICYKLQHNAYSPEGWLGARKLLRQFMQQGMTPADSRKLNRNQLDSGHRKWSVTKGAKFSKFANITWTRTVADVRLDNPETYCADIRQWATRVLADADSFVQESKMKRKS